MTQIEAEIDFVKLANDVACIKLAVLGNGKKGLCQRMDDVENGIPKVVTVCFILGGVVWAAISHFI